MTPSERITQILGREGYLYGTGKNQEVAVIIARETCCDSPKVWKFPTCRHGDNLSLREDYVDDFYFVTLSCLDYNDGPIRRTPEEALVAFLSANAPEARDD